MNVIFGRDNTELLGDRYLILELETFHDVECFCAVPLENIPKDEQENLAHFLRLHSTLVTNVKKKNYGLAQGLIPHLLGKFNGEVDSFYKEVLRRCN